MTIDEARKNAFNLVPRMSQQKVIEILGKPIETSSMTFGTSTDHPWQAICWKYLFPDSTKWLEVVFQKDTDGWVVNSWNWF
jgi:hypothetical protein